MIALRDKRVVVVGLGLSGIAACKLLASRGARVVGADSKPRDAVSDSVRALEQRGVELALGPAYGELAFDHFDLVVVSPGVPPFEGLAVAERAGVPIWSEVELAVRSLAKTAPVVAIGGTNGKSTTTSLVGALLEAHGLATFTGGNLGEPLASHADAPFDAIVLEVSSFQLERLDAFRPKVSVLLNVTPDHLDRYAGFAEYAQAKGNAFVRQESSDWAIVPASDDVCLAQARRGGGTIVTFGPGGDVDVTAAAIVDRRTKTSYPRSAIRLRGGHNALNVAASIAAVSAFALSPETIATVLATFAGLPHRMALVADRAGVRYYDDSKGTNVGASVTAIRGLDEAKVVLIAGGRDKGGSYGPLADALAAKGRAAVVLGEAAEAIASALGSELPVRRARTMDEAVTFATELAKPGDAVLLSPACSSFDMFRDYKERGDAFVEAVHALPQAERTPR